MRGKSMQDRTLMRASLATFMVGLGWVLCGCPNQAVTTNNIVVTDVGQGQNDPKQRPNLRLDGFRVAAIAEGGVAARGRILNDGLNATRKKSSVRFFLVP